MDLDCLMVVALDGTVSIDRLAPDFELDHHIGARISDGLEGAWRVDEIVLERRCLLVSELPAEALPAETLRPETGLAETPVVAPVLLAA